MRILGLDHGTKRVGVALSDELGMIAQPLEFLPAEPLEDCLGALVRLCAGRQVGQIIVGMPRNMDGSFGPAAEKVREFVAKVRERIDLPIRTWDERLTTAQAQRVLIEGNVRREKRKEKVDQLAAAILLQSYLDSVGDGSLT